MAEGVPLDHPWAASVPDGVGAWVRSGPSSAAAAASQAVLPSWAAILVDPAAASAREVPSVRASFAWQRGPAVPWVVAAGASVRWVPWRGVAACRAGHREEVRAAPGAWEVHACSRSREDRASFARHLDEDQEVVGDPRACTAVPQDEGAEAELLPLPWTW